MSPPTEKGPGTGNPDLSKDPGDNLESVAKATSRRRAPSLPLIGAVRRTRLNGLDAVLAAADIREAMSPTQAARFLAEVADELGLPLWQPAPAELVVAIAKVGDDPAISAAVNWLLHGPQTDVGPTGPTRHLRPVCDVLGVEYRLSEPDIPGDIETELLDRHRRLNGPRVER